MTRMRFVYVTFFKPDSDKNIYLVQLIQFLSLLQPSDMESEEESDDDSEYSEASEDSDSEGISLNIILLRCLIFHCFSTHIAIFCLIPFTEEELGSSEESGKDWSDLEREAAEEDKERGDDRFRDDYNSSKKKKSSRRQSPPSKDRCACIKAD